MELTDLKVFVTVAEEGNISGAAQRMDYVQSNVTARIRKLESELGVPLFHRHPKGVSLTDKGVVFREYAASIVQMSDEAVRAVQDTPYPSGPLCIGVVDTLNCGSLMRALSSFQSRHPEVSLTLLTGPSGDLLDMVLSHKLDGAFVTGDYPPAKLLCEHATRDELRLLTPLTGDEYPDLAALKWAVSPKGCPFRAILEQWLQSIGLALDNIIEISSLETLLSCVRAGLASTLLPASVLNGDDGTIGVYPVPEPFRYTKTSLVRRNDRFTSKAFTVFAEMVKASGM
ncbi:LysR family transcriptional regulator [Paenibacillus sp. NPDC056579]|uniref:LysR family transcriptional regulator n=1 Tax=Paenibacillus sp. NPDC056579 TaxID=3345871 RepID=UPI0036CFDFCC